MKHERGVGSVNAATRSIAPEITAADDGDLRLLQDPIYAERVRSWLGDPKKLLDWRHTMARCQALADMLEDRVRRSGVGGVLPPPLLAAVDQLRQMHLALRRLETNADEVTHIHVSIVDTFMANTMAVLTEFVPPERLGAAMDKVQALLEATRPRRGTNGRSTRRYG